MRRAERWWLLAVQRRATQIDVGQPVLIGPGTLRYDDGTPEFLVSASLLACFSRGDKRTNLGRFAWNTPPGTPRASQGCEIIIIMLLFDPNFRRQCSEAWIL